MKTSAIIPKTLAHLRKLRLEDLQEYCQNQRTFLIETILENGGHFSANLGTVELTVALHYVLNTPTDQLIWDVGHQAYLHKALTGRKNELKNIRKKEGISGFPKMSESAFDTFGTGHSSTSISAILGMAIADNLHKIKREHVAVIGDGSLTGGMAWEALNNAAESNTNILIIINDNQMGIDPNAGALNQYLNNINTKNNFFTELGFHYQFTQNGHDVVDLANTLKNILTIETPKIWHIKTIKGKGHAPAEAEQTKFHAVKYVKIDEAEADEKFDKFQDVFGETLLNLALQNDKIVGITPAMPTGCSMKIMMEKLPERTFDVGIAEQHAVTFAAGLAANGMIPFCNIYSTFLQRAYDQVIHDVCLQNLPVIFCLDRAGAVGEDGATHHGLYDLAYLRCLPNISIFCPADEVELRDAMQLAVELKKPIAIRYPKGGGSVLGWKSKPEISLQKPEIINVGKTTCILSIGTMLQQCKAALEKLNSEGIKVGLINMRWLKPLNFNILDSVFNQYKTLVTIEDGVVSGGFGSAISEYAAQKNYYGKIITLGFPNQVIEHATREELFTEFGLDTESIVRLIKKNH